MQNLSHGKAWASPEVVSIGGVSLEAKDDLSYLALDSDLITTVDVTFHI